MDNASEQKVSKKLQVKISKRNHVKLLLDPEQDFFKPGENFKMNAYLKDIDGKFLESTKKEVFMTVKKIYQLGICDEIEPSLINECLSQEKHESVNICICINKITFSLAKIQFNVINQETFFSYFIKIVYAPLNIKYYKNNLSYFHIFSLVETLNSEIS